MGDRKQGRQTELAPPAGHYETDTPEAAGLELIGRSPAMQRLFRLIQRIGPTDSTVLITGETGTGKDLTARAIHALSPRHARPFVALSCAAFAESLLESELFGHERGAFTGATERRAGKLELAQGGTLFLDEIGEVSPAVQVKLLRVLEERVFMRVGGTQPIRLDVRVIAATNADLEHLVAERRFREDLFYRLHVVPLVLPPLRERLEDLPLLAAHLLRQIAGGDHLALSQGALTRLAAHTWPGNVRELRNVLERAALLAEGLVIDAEHVQFAGIARSGPVAPQSSRRLDQVEREAILAGLEATGWNKVAAARRLGIAKRRCTRSCGGGGCGHPHSGDISPETGCERLLGEP